MVGVEIFGQCFVLPHTRRAQIIDCCVTFIDTTYLVVLSEGVLSAYMNLCSLCEGLVDALPKRNTMCSASGILNPDTSTQSCGKK